MTFRPRWSLLATYVALVASVLLVMGPLSRVYFLSPLTGAPAAVPALSSPSSLPAQFPPPGEEGGTGPAIGVAGFLQAVRRAMNAWVNEQLVTGDTLYAILRSGMPLPAAAGPTAQPAPTVQGIALEQVLRYALEMAGSVEIGRPWTMLASELPPLIRAELPERQTPSAAAIATVLPPWPYEQLPAPSPERRAGAERPRVLIYHTHGTEAFLGPIQEQAGIDPNVVGFTTDAMRSIIRVGDALAQSLGQRGLETLHIRELFDYQDGVVTRVGAYVQSLRHLERFRDGQSVFDVHPDIDLVLDVHRDGVPRASATAELAGQPVARLLFIVGKRDNPHWERNYCLAKQVHAELEARAPGVSRGVQVRDDARFNQHLHPHAMLVEIGTVESTLTEALLAGELLAEALLALYPFDFDNAC